jgi:hypothetical protein
VNSMLCCERCIITRSHRLSLQSAVDRLFYPHITTRECEYTLWTSTLCFPCAQPCSNEDMYMYKYCLFFLTIRLVMLILLKMA